jgi:hypothetical protein
MQTSIEWFIEHLLGNGLLRLTKEDHSLYSELRDKAKEMHKQEIMNGFNQGYREGWIDSISGDCTNDQDVETFEDANLYYKETFKKD